MARRILIKIIGCRDRCRRQRHHHHPEPEPPSTATGLHTGSNGRSHLYPILHGLPAVSQPLIKSRRKNEQYHFHFHHHERSQRRRKVRQRHHQRFPRYAAASLSFSASYLSYLTLTLPSFPRHPVILALRSRQRSRRRYPRQHQRLCRFPRGGDQE